MKIEDVRYTIKDDFFLDPDDIREQLMQFDFHDMHEHYSNATFPGKRGPNLQEALPDLFYGVQDKLCELAGVSTDKVLAYGLQAQLCLAEDNEKNWLHRDIMYWVHHQPTHVGVIYLTPNPQSTGGTIIFDPPEEWVDTGDTEDDNFPPETFIPLITMENKYNRCIQYDAEQFHRADTYFGDSKENGRLTLAHFLSLEGWEK